jgi:hypothetical protein
MPRHGQAVHLNASDRFLLTLAWCCMSAIDASWWGEASAQAS